MPVFLTKEQIYRVIQREMPPFAYPDGPASAFFSTADSMATAKVFGDAYSNHEPIYDNYFPQYATDRIGDWERLILGKPLDGSLSLQERRDRVVAKIRSRRRTTPEDIIATVHSVIDTSILVEIAEWGCEGGAWILDESQLEITTILSEFNGTLRVGPDLCQLDAADYGLTEQEFEDYQAEAYTYEVRIYGYTLSSQERADLEAALNPAEPWRSRHIILDGLDPSDSIGGDT
jgi:hypothetical protein